jgi:anaerobic sulfite reductase subunit B
MPENEYLPFSSKILEVIPHTKIEYTFRMAYVGKAKPGQFFEVSMPKYGEAPISISGIGDGFVDLTIRKVGKVTDEVFERYQGESLFLRGPYGNGFDTENYRGMDIIVATGGTGLSPVRGVIDHFARHPEERGKMTLIASFKTTGDVLFKADLERWRDTMDVILTISRPKEGETCVTGRVTDHIPGLDIPNREHRRHCRGAASAYALHRRGASQAGHSGAEHLAFPGAENVLRSRQMRPLQGGRHLYLPRRACFQIRRLQKHAGLRGHKNGYEHERSQEKRFPRH